MTQITPILPPYIEMLSKAADDPDGTVAAVTHRNGLRDPDGARLASLLREMADDGLLELQSITGDKHDPCGERVLTFRITPEGHAARPY